MGMPPITLALSKFEQIEILRTEIDTREKQLGEIEKQIRAVLYELERQKYLQTVHPIFRSLKEPEQLAALPNFEAQRGALTEALTAMRTALAALETATAGQTAPPRNTAPNAPGGRPKLKFDSFDSFKASRQS